MLSLRFQQAALVTWYGDIVGELLSLVYNRFAMLGSRKIHLYLKWWLLYVRKYALYAIIFCITKRLLFWYMAYLVGLNILDNAMDFF